MTNQENKKLYLLEDYMKLTIMQFSLREKKSKKMDNEVERESEEEYIADMYLPQLNQNNSYYDGMGKHELVDKLEAAYSRFKLTVAYKVLYQKLKEFEEIFELSQMNN